MGASSGNEMIHQTYIRTMVAAWENDVRGGEGGVIEL